MMLRASSRARLLELRVRRKRSNGRQYQRKKCKRRLTRLNRTDVNGQRPLVSNSSSSVHGKRPTRSQHLKPRMSRPLVGKRPAVKGRLSLQTVRKRPSNNNKSRLSLSSKRRRPCQCLRRRRSPKKNRPSRLRQSLRSRLRRTSRLQTHHNRLLLLELNSAMAAAAARILPARTMDPEAGEVVVVVAEACAVVVVGNPMACDTVNRCFTQHFRLVVLLSSSCPAAVSIRADVLTLMDTTRRLCNPCLSLMDTAVRPTTCTTRHKVLRPHFL